METEQTVAQRLANKLRADGADQIAELVEARARLGVLRYGVALSPSTPDLGAHLACEAADLILYGEALARPLTPSDYALATAMTQREADRLDARAAQRGDQLATIARHLLAGLDAAQRGRAPAAVSELWLAAQAISGCDHTADARAELALWLRERQRASVG